MNPSVIILIGAVFALSYILSRYQKNKNAKFSQKFKNVNFREEFNNAERYKAQYLDDDLFIVKKQMEGKAIDAYTFANLPLSKKSMFKDGAKDVLKGAATLGMVSFQTIITPKYLVLSKENLHLLDTDKNGAISGDWVFNKERLLQSSLEEISLEGPQKDYAHKMGENVRGYKLTLATDKDPIVLVLFSALICTAPNFYHVNSFEKSITEIVIANDFLKNIGDLYPNLKVSVPILQ